jgi:ABC-type glycerol-3-phosphate transport system substrate-binding protein
LTEGRSAVRILLSLLAGVFTLTACGAPGAAVPTPQPVTLRFAARQNVADYAPLVAQFQKLHPNIVVNVTPIRQGSANSLADLSTLGTDVVRYEAPYLPDAQFAQQFLPLDERMNAAAFPVNDMLPGALQSMRANGVQYGIPAGINPAVGYYDRKRLPGAAGLTAGWTTDTLLQAALSVNHQDKMDLNDPALSIGFCSDPAGADPVIFAYLFGGGLVDSLASPGRATLDAVANIRSLQWYAALRQQYGVIPDPDAIRQLFRQRGLYDAIALGKCGVWLGFYSDLGGKTWGSKWIGDPVMLPLPHGQTTISVASADGYFIFRQSKHGDEAWMWIEYLVDHQEPSGMLAPPLRSQIQSDAFARRVSPDVLLTARSLQGNLIMLGASIPQGAGSIFSIYLAAVDQVVRGQADAKSALAAAQTKAALVFAQAQ